MKSAFASRKQPESKDKVSDRVMQIKIVYSPKTNMDPEVNDYVNKLI